MEWEEFLAELERQLERQLHPIEECEVKWMYDHGYMLHFVYWKYRKPLVIQK